MSAFIKETSLYAAIHQFRQVHSHHGLPGISPCTKTWSTHADDASRRAVPVAYVSIAHADGPRGAGVTNSSELKDYG